MMTLERLIEIVKEAAQFMQTDSFEVTQKEGYSNIVTTSDVAVQSFLCNRLSAELPGCNFICEEEDLHAMEEKNRNVEDATGACGSSQKPAEADRYTWIIDPIDGTANYSRGVAQCAICVGLKKNDAMEMGVVYLPAANELFSAERGKGAYLNGKQIHVSKRPFANSILCTALPVYHKEFAPICGRIIEKAFVRCNDIRRFGACAPELCYLAMGRCELYFEYLLSPWDFAAASLILQEAGGVLCDLQGNTLTCTKGSGVIAANNQDNLREMLTIVKAER